MGRGEPAAQNQQKPGLTVPSLSRLRVHSYPFVDSKVFPIGVHQRSSAVPSLSVGFVLSAAIIFGSLAVGAAAGPEIRNPQSAIRNPKLPPEAEKVSEGVYRIGRVLLDTKARTVTCPGFVNMLRGPIEYLAVTPTGKRHESVFVLEVDPTHLHVALLLLGLEPGGNLRFQGDAHRPAGAPVEVEVRWSAGGRDRSARLEESAWDIPKRRPMESHPWVFTGSRITDAGFGAALEGSLIACYNDPYAILNNPLPTGADDTVYKVNERLVPPVKTPVTLILRPAPAAPAEGVKGLRVGQI
jgi:hypothetical protein